MREEEYKSILSRYLPASAVEPVYNYVCKNSVRLKITPVRTTKLGDYRCPTPQRPCHEISINGDLPKYFFLMVLLHEMAHMNTFLVYGRKVQPHGHEWQEHYRRLLIEYFVGGHFPPETYPLFKRYTARIPLNRAAGQELEKVLKRDGMAAGDDSCMTLAELPIGSSFRLKSKPDKLFVSIEKRRTRYLVSDSRTGLRYLISGAAEILATRASSSAVDNKPQT